MHKLLFLPLAFIITSSCQTLYTDIPKGTTSDESITQLVLDYRKVSSDKVIGTIRNKSKYRIYDIRIKITITPINGSNTTERFVISKINPYENRTFKKVTETNAIEMNLQIQSSHY